MELSQFELLSILQRISQYLNKPTRLVLIGSSVGMLHGQPSRMTEDIDVWRPSSILDDGDMRQACERAGVLYDPKGDIPEDKPYLQMIMPGIVQLGDYKTELKIYNFGNLEVLHPPVENIIASKLLRAELRDIEDCIFLRSKFSVEREKIENVIKSFHGIKSEMAMENLVYLDVASPLLLGE